MKSDEVTASAQWLIPQVTKPSGVDLAQALRDGVLTPADYLETVRGCRSCDDPEACARWLEDVQAHGKAEGHAPALTATFCTNAPLVLELRAL